MDRELFLNLKERFKPVMEEKAIHAVLVFGSQVSGKNSSRSDIDICIVAPGTRNKEEILRKIWRTVEGDFDLWLFEELPLYLKIAVISEHIVLYCPKTFPPYMNTSIFIVNSSRIKLAHALKICRFQVF